MPTTQMKIYNGAVWVVLASQIASIVFLAVGASDLVGWFSVKFVEPAVGDMIDEGWENITVGALRWFTAYWWFYGLVIAMIEGLLSVPLVVISKRRPIVDRIAWVAAVMSVPLPMPLVFSLAELHYLRTKMSGLAPG